MILYHFPLCPFSRQIRLILKEKELDFTLQQENYWERSNELALLNPAMELPVLIDKAKSLSIADIAAIYEYLEEVYPDKVLLGLSPKVKAEVRRITNWFNIKFFREVTNYLVNEKIIRYYKQDGEPNSHAIRAAKMNITYHLDYIGFLLEQHKWLAAEELTIADFAASSQLSVLDYLGDVPWNHNPRTKEWYALIKSRPSFRPLLTDYIQGFPAAKHYDDVDF
jgi:glutathione S-transferase